MSSALSAIDRRDSVDMAAAAGLASFTVLTPVFGVLCGGVILGEPLTIRIVVALGLIAAWLIVVNRPARRHPIIESTR